MVLPKWRPCSTRKTHASSATAETSPLSLSRTNCTRRPSVPHSSYSRKGRSEAPSVLTKSPSASRVLLPSASRTSSPPWPRPALPRATRGTLRYARHATYAAPMLRSLLAYCSGLCQNMLQEILLWFEQILDARSMQCCHPRMFEDRASWLGDGKCILPKDYSRVTW